MASRSCKVRSGRNSREAANAHATSPGSITRDLCPERSRPTLRAASVAVSLAGKFGCAATPAELIERGLLIEAVFIGFLGAVVGAVTGVLGGSALSGALAEEHPGPTLAWMQRMADLGIRTLYLETANYRQTKAIVYAKKTAKMIETAHDLGMQVVAWYLPGFRDHAKDERRSLAAVDLVAMQPDPRRRLPADKRVFSDGEAPTLLVCAEEHAARGIGERVGVRVVERDGHAGQAEVGRRCQQELLAGRDRHGLQGNDLPAEGGGQQQREQERSDDVSSHGASGDDDVWGHLKISRTVSRRPVAVPRRG